jgi:hypothetical protein
MEVGASSIVVVGLEVDAPSLDKQMGAPGYVVRW